ncbi:putative ATP-grasp-modified RiPP [Streptomyces sp. NPDC007084]|uniref:putative ATP-grasp-modified RiPP n=1 Tax=Streptomyces sp. NPDC007084 TaxID=3154313 RepID=UPI0034530512
MRPFALNYVRAAVEYPADAPYVYDPELQLNVLQDGRAAIDDHDLLRALGNTTSTAGSKTHFDD